MAFKTLAALVMIVAGSSCKSQSERIAPALTRAVLLYIDSMNVELHSHVGDTSFTSDSIYLRLPDKTKPSARYLKQVGTLPFKVLGFVKTSNISYVGTVVSIEDVTAFGADSAEVYVIFNPEAGMASSGTTYLATKVNGEWKVYGTGMGWVS